jgi:LemA protein
MKKWLLLVLVLALATGAAAVSVGKRAIPQYDELVRLRENTQREWSQIDVLLQRRYELIPRLVDAVKGYDAHETSTLVAAAEAWTHYGSASTLEEKLQASYRVEQGLRSFAVFGQLHPDLKANGLYLETMSALRDTEDQIARQRMAYNSAASALNSQVNSFYGRFVAWAGGIHAAPYYEPPEEVRAPPVANLAPAEASVTAHAGELILKGTIGGGRARQAVLELPDGKQLIVSAGMQIREVGAKVVSVGEGEVTLVEQVRGQHGSSNTREIRIRH